jgi:hypothetical protein
MQNERPERAFLILPAWRLRQGRPFLKEMNTMLQYFSHEMEIIRFVHGGDI